MNITDFNPVGAVLDIGSKLIDHFFPNPADAAAAKLKLLELQQNGALAELASTTSLAQAQAVIDQNEATNSSLFVAGWRPWIGWVCGMAFAYAFVVQPFAVFIAAAVGHPITLPALDLSQMSPVLMGMLGLGAMRTVEKVNGVKTGQ